ncbi:uncharacterized protein BDZ99DRAFT_510065 [Mytilinidion resinicola]|uniref:Thioredoxin domain-containing protein n=1 Tax=Mytilinidion resinicola TaxID=574789 RepID=A0A6A6YHA6_9PEZI|nr:uncharacterized protein BDZ99DRAFT_510065 [Mytilinidion resinicola]KAF2807979.1 hypothetical protein BDZ99DRAFT_510065 [Mytilinidion resinicola]
MTFQQELKSWWSPTKVEISPVPAPGQQAPSTDRLPILSSGGKPTVVTFLRHCGCPFAEKTFISLRKTAEAHPDMRFIAVSHSDQESTDKWLNAVGGADRVNVIVDPDRELFGRWGLGVSSFMHVLNPAGLWSVYRLGKEENIWNRPTESGSRWQTSGSFAVDGEGKVKWGGPAQRADEIPSFEEAVELISK